MPQKYVPHTAQISSKQTRCPSYRTNIFQAKASGPMDLPDVLDTLHAACRLQVSVTERRSANGTHSGTSASLCPRSKRCLNPAPPGSNSAPLRCHPQACLMCSAHEAATSSSRPAQQHTASARTSVHRLHSYDKHGCAEAPTGMQACRAMRACRQHRTLEALLAPMRAARNGQGCYQPRSSLSASRSPWRVRPGPAPPPSWPQPRSLPHHTSLSMRSMHPCLQVRFSCKLCTEASSCSGLEVRY